MGYYSEIGAAMFKEDFENLIKECMIHETEDKYKDALFCIMKCCDHYYYDIWQEERYDKEKRIYYKINKPRTVIILHWSFIKHSKGRQYIHDYISQHGGCWARVGEDYGDIEFEQWDPPETELYIDWYEYVEPQAYVQIEGGKEQINNYDEFIKALP